MIDEKHVPDESEATEQLNALDATESADEGKHIPTGADTLVKIKSSEPSLTEQSNTEEELDDIDEAEAYDADCEEESELTSDERLAALIYDDEDDGVQLKTDTAAPSIDIFSIGSMIPRIERTTVAEDVAEAVDEAVEEPTESEVEEDDRIEEEANASPEATDVATAEDSSETDVDEPTQLEFDISTPESTHREDTGDSADEVTEEKAPDNTSDKKYDPENPRFIDTVFGWLELLLFTLVSVMVLTSFVFKLSVVDGSSMDKTLYGGERLIIYSLFYEPERFDIIVCEDYSTRLKKPIVKRVIALPGEHLVITADGTVTVDGVEIDESDYVYINQSDYVYSPIDIVIPEGTVFVMGDHRNISDDSRSEGVGPIDIDSILGKVVLRIYPFDRFGTVD